MRAALVLMIGMIFWFVTPAISEARQTKQDENSGYSQHRDEQRGDEVGYQQQNQMWNKARNKQQKAWDSNRRSGQHWKHQARYQPPVQVVYRDLWPYQLFPRIVIHIPL